MKFYSGSGVIKLFLFLIFLTTSTSALAKDGKGGVSPTTNRFLDLSPEERMKLVEFRESVGPNLIDSYMSKDEYLLRFLKQTRYNISSSQDLILQMLKWRNENKVQDLLDESYPEFEAEYNIYLEGCDYENRPVISVPFGNWDIRRASLAGLGPRLARFMDKLFEDATSFLRSVNEIGIEIYQATLILDLDGFDMKTHACPKCIQLYLYFFTSLQTHYPGLVEKIYFINTPQIVNLIWDVYKDVFTKELRAITTIHGKDVKDWKEKLRQVIPPSSLSTKLGGDKVLALDFVYIRQGEQLISSLDKVGAIRVNNNCEKDLVMYETLIREMNRVMEKRKEAVNEFEWGCPKNEF